MIQEINDHKIYIGEGKKARCFHLSRPSGEEINEILMAYPMPRDFISSGLDSDERPRMETYTNKEGEEIRLFVFLNPARDGSGRGMDSYCTRPISLVLGPDFIISTALGDDKDLGGLLWDSVGKDTMTGFEWLVGVFWKVSQAYIDFLDGIEDRIKDIEAKARVTTKNSILYDLVGINKGLIYFESSLRANGQVLADINKEVQGLAMGPDAGALVRDVQVEHDQALALVEEYRDLVGVLDDMLSNIISNNMNQIMKRLTGWTIALAIPATLTTIWTMDLAMVFSAPKYWMSIGVILIISLGFYMSAKSQ